MPYLYQNFSYKPNGISATSGPLTSALDFASMPIGAEIESITGVIYTKIATGVFAKSTSAISSTIQSLLDLKANIITWTTRTAAYTAVIGDGILADTSGGGFTVTLPTISTIGDAIHFLDPTGTWATNNLTIATSANNTIEGLASPMVADISKSFSLVATSLTDWRLF